MRSRDQVIFRESKSTGASRFQPREARNGPPGVQPRPSQGCDTNGPRGSLEIKLALPDGNRAFHSSRVGKSSVEPGEDARKAQGRLVPSGRLWAPPLRRLGDLCGTRTNLSDEIHSLVHVLLPTLAGRAHYDDRGSLWPATRKAAPRSSREGAGKTSGDAGSRRRQCLVLVVLGSRRPVLRSVRARLRSPHVLRHLRLDGGVAALDSAPAPPILLG